VNTYIGKQIVNLFFRDMRHDENVANITLQRDLPLAHDGFWSLGEHDRNGIVISPCGNAVITKLFDSKIGHF
jgi:hypothetical protein